MRHPATRRRHAEQDSQHLQEVGFPWFGQPVTNVGRERGSGGCWMLPLIRYIAERETFPSLLSEYEEWNSVHSADKVKFFNSVVRSDDQQQSSRYPGSDEKQMTRIACLRGKQKVN
jgi:hypothetical protein